MIAFVEAYKEHKRIYKLMEEVNVIHESWLEYSDSQTVKKVSHACSYTKLANHIELRNVAIQNIFNRGDIAPRFCAYGKNAADILTNALLPHANEIGTRRL